MCGIYDTNEFIYKTNRLTDIENRVVVVKKEERRRRMDWEFGIQFSSVQSLIRV